MISNDVFIEQTAQKFDEFAVKADNLSSDCEIPTLIDEFSKNIRPFDSLSDIKLNFLPTLKGVNSKTELSRIFRDKANEIRKKGTIWFKRK